MLCAAPTSECNVSLAAFWFLNDRLKMWQTARGGVGGWLEIKRTRADDGRCGAPGLFLGLSCRKHRSRPGFALLGRFCPIGVVLVFGYQRK